MANLIKWEKHLPDDFYATKSHMWILLDGKIRWSKKESIHAVIWGAKAWDIPERGYYNDELGLIFCHGNCNPQLEKSLAKKFPKAIYIYSSW